MATLRFWTTTAKTDAIAVLALPAGGLTQEGHKLDRKHRGEISRRRREDAFLVKRQASSLLYSRNAKIILAAFPEKDSRTVELREAAYSAIRIAQKHAIQRITIAFDPQNEAEVQAIGEGSLLATYSYSRFKSQKTDRGREVRTIYIRSSELKTAPLKKAKVFTDATMFVRDLVNDPPNLMNPESLSEVAKDAAVQNALNLRVFETAQLLEMGANAFLSVGMGSIVPCRMIHAAYEPQMPARTHVCLVGKGVTFDSGGLSLKSEKGMEHMKSDMAGAAIALACVKAASELKLPVKVTALLMATENMPDSGANRPGDVVRAMNGKTIEITNTDAEGRLALADGLVYAQSLKPDYLIDIATLTGAQVVALGRLVAAAMGNNEAFIQQLVEAGKRSGEMLWPLPLPDHYRDLIKSDIADMKNSSGIPDAGSIQGGLFLSEFVNHPRWVHLDIAGPSFQDREWSVHQRNATGFGARCLLTFLDSL